MQTAEPTLGDPSIVSQSVTNNRAPHVGAQEKSGGHIKKISALYPHLQIASDATVQCIHVGDQERLCFCTLELIRPYQCLVQVYFGADTEITAIPYPR